MKDDPVIEHLGVVCGQYINRMSFFRHQLERIRGFFGGRSLFHETEISQTRDAAVTHMIAQADVVGATKRSTSEDRSSPE
ncbi:MAG: heavy metal-binding domain-containing protein [Actinomycetaceae bacterium]|nr:heavy metal-binding domain-containing protein [Actinomycetaceae bacterium]